MIFRKHNQRIDQLVRERIMFRQRIAELNDERDALALENAKKGDEIRRLRRLLAACESKRLRDDKRVDL